MEYYVCHKSDNLWGRLKLPIEKGCENETHFKIRKLDITKLEIINI